MSRFRNATAMQFGTPTEAWQDNNEWTAYDAASGGNRKLPWYQFSNNPSAPQIGDTVQFAIGDIDIDWLDDAGVVGDDAIGNSGLTDSITGILSKNLWIAIGLNGSEEDAGGYTRPARVAADWNITDS